MKQFQKYVDDVLRTTGFPCVWLFLVVYLQAQKSNMLTPDMGLDVRHVKRKGLLNFLPAEIAEQLKATPTMRKTVSIISTLTQWDDDFIVTCRGVWSHLLTPDLDCPKSQKRTIYP